MERFKICERSLHSCYVKLHNLIIDKIFKTLKQINKKNINDIAIQDNLKSNLFMAIKSGIHSLTLSLSLFSPSHSKILSLSHFLTFSFSHLPTLLLSPFHFYILFHFLTL